MILVLVCFALGIAALVFGYHKLVVWPLRELAETLTADQRGRLRYGYVPTPWHRGQPGLRGFCKAHDLKQIWLLALLAGFAVFFSLVLQVLAPIDRSEVSAATANPTPLACPCQPRPGVSA